jgi:hypothetical protein
MVGAAWTACVLTARDDAPAPSKTLDDPARQAAFRELASEEASQRARASRTFPWDAWSQDDDFHANEMLMAMRIARTRGVALGDVLRALDDGMREQWPLPPSANVRPSVPPCRPRPIY